MWSGMSKNQRAVHIYRFKGSGGPADERPAESLNFKDFFELKHETAVLRESEMLSKDFCLVTANGRFNNGKLIDLHRIGWFNHDDDELVLARYRDFNEQYIAQQTISSNSPFYHHGYSFKDEDSNDYRAKDRYESFALAPTMSSLAEFSADATYHQVPSGSSNNIGVAPRINHAHPAYIAQMAYNQAHHDEVRQSTAEMVIGTNTTIRYGN
ncbi:hypothetical protein BG011_006727 [Mortierella polycephala]|uniref:Uncharacterized protein n=1 Tax=Mortierella polycephala TaxID=41804 RepID=A0A9P6PVC6_9FUNG|nr:hypothetical protein BG011_006727 [Mortierella polycephala]